MSLFIYHAVPDPVLGTRLMPLNQLKQHHREVYLQHVEKYTGREELMQKPVLPLRCFWNDVLMFSPVHPASIRDALVEEGHSWRSRRWYCLSATDVAIARSCFYYAPEKRPSCLSDSQEEEFEAFSIETLRRHQTLPEKTQGYYKSVARGEPLFPFQFIPHVFIHDTIPCDRMDTIEC